MIEQEITETLQTIEIFLGLGLVVLTIMMVILYQIGNKYTDRHRVCECSKCK